MGSSSLCSCTYLYTKDMWFSCAMTPDILGCMDDHWLWPPSQVQSDICYWLLHQREQSMELGPVIHVVSNPLVGTFWSVPHIDYTNLQVRHTYTTPHRIHVHSTLYMYLSSAHESGITYWLRRCSGVGASLNRKLSTAPQICPQQTYTGTHLRSGSQERRQAR